MEKVFKEYEGTVVFLKSNAGSKSEAAIPYVYIDKNTIVPVMKEDDNPFENTGLVEYDGKKVKINGYEGRSNTFIITKLNNATDEQGDN